MSNILKIALIALVLVYIGGLTYTYYSNTKFQQEVDIYDLNKNGLIDTKEITKESIAIARQQAKRKTTKQGAIVLIPMSLIIGLFVYGMAYLFRKIKMINDNEILYRRRN